jgi:uncharacterized protein (DUF1330 family)
MSVYFVVNGTVKDAALLEEYVQGAFPTLGIVPTAKVHVLDLESEVIEGTPAGRRTVILEFDSRDDFESWYQSPDYQAVVGKRLEATEGFAVLTKGFS